MRRSAYITPYAEVVDIDAEKYLLVVSPDIPYAGDDNYHPKYPEDDDEEDPDMPEAE